MDVTPHSPVKETRPRLMPSEALSTLNQIVLDILSRHELGELLEVVVARATELLDAPYGEIMLLEDDVLVVRAFTSNQPFLLGDRVEQGEALLSWQAVRSRRPAVLSDYSKWQHRRELYEGRSYFAVADFPILSGDKCLDVLVVGRDIPGYVFDAEEIQVGSLFAELVALALDNTQLYAAAQSELNERKQAQEALQTSREYLDTANVNSKG